MYAPVAVGWANRIVLGWWVRCQCQMRGRASKGANQCAGRAAATEDNRTKPWMFSYDMVVRSLSGVEVGAMYSVWASLPEANCAAPEDGLFSEHL